MIAVTMIVATMAPTVLRAAEDMPRIFAACTGRFSAEMEHAWLTNSTAADDHAATRRTFISLVEATMIPGTGAETLAHRIDAKMAQAHLRSVQTFSDAPDRAAAAQRRADWHLGQCRALLLDS